VPPPPIRRPRDLTRYRIDLVNARGAEKNRVEKLLAALIAGERDPKVLAQLARSRRRTKITLPEEAFTGHFTDHHAFLPRRIVGPRGHDHR
jgi:hypothetical protein